MPTYQDATGFLIELRNAINQSWFNAIVDLSISLDSSRATEEQLESIWTYLIGTNDYQSTAATPPPNQNSQESTISPVFLEKVNTFNNFKKLSPNLNIEFDKKITLIFGKNGSGKTSLCQALKVLANPVKPVEPLFNARNGNKDSLPSFQYQFKGWVNPSEWSESNGYGSQAQFIKYFDSTVAMSISTGTMKAEKAVEVSVFRLELFDFTRSVLTDFQQHANNKLTVQRGKISTDMEAVRNRLRNTVNIEVEPFSNWSPESPHAFERWITGINEFGNKEEVILKGLENEYQQLQSSTSEQGVIALQAQLNLLENIGNNIKSLSENCSAASIIKLGGLEETLIAKNAALAELSRSAFPSHVNASQHNELINAVARFFEYGVAEHCPLCLQDLNSQAKQLFSAYHHHLTSTLHQEIISLNSELKIGLKQQKGIKSSILADSGILKSIFPPMFFESLTGIIETIKTSLPNDGQSQKDGNMQNFNKWMEMANFIAPLEQQANQIRNTLKIAQEGKDAIIIKVNEIKNKIGSMNAHKSVYLERQNLLNICSQSTEYSRKASKAQNIDFTSVLRKLTLKGKEAHSQLVLDTFEQKLNSEYIAMSGMSLEELGVKLTSKGNDQDITVTPKIGKVPVHRVLSEGEQKVHSLAVYMAEAIAQPYQLLVFDDPVTSFDYNYISNFCERIRDYIRNNQDTQIILLTHNWDFFVNFQTTLNRSGLNNSLSVQVLEDCSTVSEYSEKWDHLCEQIENIVNSTAEPNEAQKEIASGLMRRLLERLTNAYVFNEQRHQYKIKSLQDSNFHNFTKIVPLTVQEADDLRDLYSNLSPPEHDDVRNFYTTKTRIQFKNWYDKIIGIKVSIENRRP
jgi:energy-coupling factor transporter ATP-binding protein EcfA2